MRFVDSYVRELEVDFFRLVNSYRGFVVFLEFCELGVGFFVVKFWDDGSIVNSLIIVLW